MRVASSAFFLAACALFAPLELGPKAFGIAQWPLFLSQMGRPFVALALISFCASAISAASSAAWVGVGVGVG